jgi:hypothetical protein
MEKAGSLAGGFERSPAIRAIAQMLRDRLSRGGVQAITEVIIEKRLVFLTCMPRSCVHVH